MYRLVEVDRDVVGPVLVPPQYSRGEPAAARIQDFDDFSYGVGHVFGAAAGLGRRGEAGFFTGKRGRTAPFARETRWPRQRGPTDGHASAARGNYTQIPATRADFARF